MRRLAVIAAAALGLAGGSAGGAAAHPSLRFAARAGVDTTPQVSSNWAGYVALPPETTTVSFADVTATWKQPKGRCVSGRSDSAAFWVGLGGFNADSQALEQLGTEIDCAGDGTAAHYSAWWEIVPAGSVKIPLKIAAGDTIAAALLADGRTVTLSMRNLTRKTRFSKRITVAHDLDVTSAEWIAEAPSLCSSSGRCRAVPLTNFGNVSFSSAALTGSAHTGTLTDPAWTMNPIELISGGGGGLFDRGDPLGPGVGAVPGVLGPDGRSFAVAWQQSVTPPSP